MTGSVAVAVVRRQVRLHGHTLSYLDAGPADGPVLVLIHGLASDAGAWHAAMPSIAARGIHVIAPDLFGHGRSDRPPTDYSVAGFSNSVRDLLILLGHDHATLGGHSLGGGVAVQFLYQYPERCQRVILVAAGGMGRDVHPVLRLATLPGIRALLGLLVNPTTVRLFEAIPWLPRLLGLPPIVRGNLARVARSLAAPRGRAAFYSTLSFIIGPAGQRVSALDKLYLAAHLPVLLISSERDSTIPLSHARRVHDRLPQSQLVVLPGSSHEPHRRHPRAFADAVADFMLSTPPCSVDGEHLAGLLATGGEPRPYWT